MTKAEKKRSPGRPQLPAAEKKRRNFTFRGTDGLHEQLSKAAAESGRSVSEEIEWRLSQTFADEGYLGYLNAHAQMLADSLKKEMRQQIFAAITGAPAETAPPADATPKGLLAALGYSLKPDGSAK